MENKMKTTTFALAKCSQGVCPRHHEIERLCSWAGAGEASVGYGLGFQGLGWIEGLKSTSLSKMMKGWEMRSGFELDHPEK